MVQSESIQRLIQLIATIGDEQFQRDAWFGKGPFVSSPGEMFCQYFDDLCAEEVIAEEMNNLSKSQADALRLLNVEMNSFSEASDEQLDAAKTFTDPRWEKIRQIARSTAALFDRR